MKRAFIHTIIKVILGCYVYSDPFSRTEFLFGEHDVINHNWNFINMVTFTFTYLLSVFHIYLFTLCLPCNWKRFNTRRLVASWFSRFCFKIRMKMSRIFPFLGIIMSNPSMPSNEREKLLRNALSLEVKMLHWLIGSGFWKRFPIMTQNQ